MRKPKQTKKQGSQETRFTRNKVHKKQGSQETRFTRKASKPNQSDQASKPNQSGQASKTSPGRLHRAFFGPIFAEHWKNELFGSMNWP